MKCLPLVGPEQEPNKDTRRLTERQAGTGIEILDRIVATKRLEVAELVGSETDLTAKAQSAPSAMDFLPEWRASETVSVIAEVKRRSPGAGDINTGLSPSVLAGGYAEGGAAAISVLTDGTYFQGSLGDLVGLRQQIPIPLLRKDFVIDERQVYEARGAGADLVLLIVRILSQSQLLTLHRLVSDLGMVALVEVHDEEELSRAMEVGGRLIGINNRDLNTFQTDLSVTERLAPGIPSDVLLVAESGIKTVEDVQRVADAGADAILVGEALVRSANPRDAVAAFSAVARRGR